MLRAWISFFYFTLVLMPFLSQGAEVDPKLFAAAGIHGHSFRVCEEAFAQPEEELPVQGVVDENDLDGDVLFLWRDSKRFVVQADEEVFTAYVHSDKQLQFLRSLEGVSDDLKLVYKPKNGENIYRVKVKDGIEIQSLIQQYNSASAELQADGEMIAYSSYVPKVENAAQATESQEQSPLSGGENIFDRSEAQAKYYLTRYVNVRFKSNLKINDLKSVVQKSGAEVDRQYDFANFFRLKLPKGIHPLEYCELLRSKYGDSFESAEPDLIHRSRKAPQAVGNFGDLIHSTVEGGTNKDSDPTNLFELQWWLNSQEGFLPEHVAKDADIGALDAWKYSDGTGAVAAIIDDSFEVNRPEFEGRVIDPIFFNEMTEDVAPTDGTQRHGTPVMGLIGANDGTESGFKGVAPGIGLVPVKISLGVADSDMVGLFQYVSERADIVNNSWGPPPVYAPISDLMKEHFYHLSRYGGRSGRGLVIVFAAGNWASPIQSFSNELLPWFNGQGVEVSAGPIENGMAANPNVIAVGGVSSLNKQIYYSSFGSAEPGVAQISVAAPTSNGPVFPTPKVMPGAPIFSTDNYISNSGYADGSKYARFGGTSAAAPVTTGVGGLVIAQGYDLALELHGHEVRKILEISAQFIEDKEINPWRELAVHPQSGLGTSQGRELIPVFGHGKVDAGRASTVTQNWKAIKAQAKEITFKSINLEFKFLSKKARAERKRWKKHIEDFSTSMAPDLKFLASLEKEDVFRYLFAITLYQYVLKSVAQSYLEPINGHQSFGWKRRLVGNSSVLVDAMIQGSDLQPLARHKFIKGILNLIL